PSHMPERAATGDLPDSDPARAGVGDFGESAAGGTGVGCWASALPRASAPSASSSVSRRAPPLIIIVISAGERATSPITGWSRDQPALEQPVGDRGGDLVDDGGAHLRVAPQQLDDALLVRRCRLASLLPELLTGRLLILLDHLVGDHVEDRE